MVGYLLKRLAQLLPVVLIIIVVNFVLIRLAPGDPVVYLIGEAPASEEQIAQLRHELALDQSLPKQLFAYLVNIAQGDFGYSYVSRAPVLEVIFARLPQHCFSPSRNTCWPLLVALFLASSLHNGREAWLIRVQHFFRSLVMRSPSFGSGRC